MFCVNCGHPQTAGARFCASCGVAVSAVVNSTVLGITVLWMLLYGGGFALTLLPQRFPSPDRVLHNLPHILRGAYNINDLGELSGWALGASVFIALVGLVAFSRRDV